MFERPPFDILQDSLADPSNPIGMRMRALYYLRQAHHDDEKLQGSVVQALGRGLLEEKHGSLMRHEFAYVMGQLRDERCCHVLEQVLAQPDDNIMVRHEAAEALGAIGASRSKTVLEKVMVDNPDTPELSDTCQLALNVMHWRATGGDPLDMPAACACMLNPYSSVDPAPPHPTHAAMSFSALGELLCDAERTIFERYRAMFSLRNRGGEAAVVELCRALTQDTSSALLRHEVAYVLGQMQHPSSVESLEASLRRTDEHEMVRHESAEALGAIDGRWEDVERVLLEFVNDQDDVVKESCLVALDAADYWGHARQGDDDCPKKSNFNNQKNRDERVLVNHFNVKV
jgi:deoxyhypusine monooxygenase